MEIGNCERLETLGIRSNKLKYLPSSLGRLHRLRWLTFEANQLKCVPDSLESLKKLIHFNLKNNRLKRIPNCLSKMRKLRFVFLNHNRINTMISDQHLQKLSFIDMLNLCGNPISSLSWAKDRVEVRLLF